MTEMDFEELDKAVNSLMQKAGAVPTDSSDTAIASVLEPERHHSEKASDKVQQANAELANPAKEPAPKTPPVSVASKRQRRFMDIVPQKTSTIGVSTATHPPKRQGVTLQPLTMQNDLPTNNNDSSSPRHEPAVAENEAVRHDMSFDAEPATGSGYDAQSRKVDDSWENNDHIADGDDMNDQLDAVVASAEPTVSPTILQDAHEEIRSAQSSADIPLTSPFLPDAKVEKRPLGGSATFQEPAQVSHDDARLDMMSSADAPQVDEGVDDHGVDLQTAPRPSHTSLPEEFSGAIMAIESSAVPHAEERMENVAVEVDKKYDTNPAQTAAVVLPAPVVTPTPKAEETPTLAAVDPQEQKDEAKDENSQQFGDEKLFDDASTNTMLSSDDEVTPRKTEKSRGSTKIINPPKRPAVENGSIIQQYAEQPSTSSQETVAIYDTKSYHQPLEHPAKRTSSAVIVMWILVLLIVGALAGAALFYFNSQ